MLTITAPTELTYDGTAKEATVSGTIPGITTPDIVYTKNDAAFTGTPTDAGTYTASITLGGVTASVSYTIAPKSVTVSGVTAENKEYDGTTDATLVYSGASFGKCGSDDLTVSATGAFADANAGDGKTVNISGLTLGGTGAGNYVLAESGQQTSTTANITPKSITGATVTLSATQLEYTGSEQTVSVTGVTLGDTPLTAETDYEVTDGTTGTEKNTYTVTVTGKGNYTGTATATWAITDKPMTVSAPDVTATYDGTAHGVTVTVSEPGNGYVIKYGESEGSYTLNASPTITGVGESPKTVYFQVTADNYATYTGSATITINKAPLTVTAKPKTITYGDTPADDGVEYSGFVNNETGSVLGGTLGYDYNYTQYGDVGSYTITPKGLTAANYEISFATGTLTVEQKEVGLTWNNTTLTFDGTAQAPTATATETVNGDTISVTVSGAQTNAGTGYTATASGLTGNKADNYKLPTTGLTQEFSIGKAAAQTLSDIALNKAAGTSSITASVAGLMPTNAGTLGYTAGSATTTGSATVSNFTVDSTGAITATISGGAAGDTVTLPVTISSTNYEDSTVSVVVTFVNKTDANVSISGESTKTYGDAAFTLTANAANPGENGAWTWESSNTGVATVTNAGVVTIVGCGTTAITAFYDSDTTTGSASMTLTVNPKSVAIPTAASGLKWTGSAQTGVASGEGYTVANGAATAVGSYTATATLTNTVNYQWSDGTTEAKSIPWSIAKADGPAAPTGLAGVAPTTDGGSDGKIAGVTTEMEYSADGSSYTPCSGTEITGLSAGTYYVRYQETATHEAGAAATVSVPAYNPPAPGTVATPTFSPAGGTFTSAQNVTISCATDGATIHYTMDGTTPTESSPTYSAPISVSATTTIKATAVKSGWTNSAVASATYTINIPGATYTATVVNGTGGGKYAEGATVTITANAPAAGKVFDKWVSDDGVSFADATSATTTFTMPAKNVTVTATYKNAPAATYTVTVVNGMGGGEYAEGATVTVTANAPAAGKVFDKWVSDDGVSFADATSATTTFTMPAKNVTVTATYKNAPAAVYTITVTDDGHGTGKATPASGTTGTKVTLTATANAGYHFREWQVIDAGGGTLRGNTFTIGTANATVRAVFEKDAPYVPPYEPGGDVYRPTYTPTVSAEHGTVTISSSNPERGDMVTVTVKPDSGYEVDTVSVTDSYGRSVNVKDNGDGTYTFTQPGSKVTIRVAFKAAQFAPTTDPLDAYADLDKGAWYAESVRYVVEKGIMKGMGDGSFAPDATASRAQIAQMFFNLDGATADGNLASFVDVSVEDWYADAVTWMVENGIASGMGDDFGANEDVTREQLAVMLYNYADFKGYDVSVSGDVSSFPDAGNVNGYAQQALAWAVGAGLINGTTDENGNVVLDPQGSATRAQIAAIIMRFCENVAK